VKDRIVAALAATSVANLAEDLPAVPASDGTVQVLVRKS
jgi:hypothetical protein